MGSIAYRPEIDGLRAVAILAVLAFHIDPAWMPGGFAGVDVFFVISGYLITSIIYQETEQGRFSFRRFYARRFRRLFPAMAVVLVAILGVGAMIDPTSYELIRRTGLWVLLFSANIYLWKMTGDYWAAASEDDPLLHTWSLGVEEQFYLTFPIALVGLLKWKRQWAFSIVGAIAAVSFGGCVWGTTFMPSASFYLLPTRAWELLIGCLLAIYPPAIAGRLAKCRWAGILSGLGLAMIGASYLVLQGGQGFPGYKAALPTAGAGLVIAFAGGVDGVASRLLRCRWMVLVGKSSYSLYLWHWPVIVFLKRMQDNPAFPSWMQTEATGLACVILSLSLATASYACVEGPSRAWRGTSWAGACAFAGILATLGLMRPNSVSTTYGTADLAAGFAPITVRGPLFGVQTTWPESAREKFKHLHLLFPDSAPSLDEGVTRAYGTAQIDVLVLGDSHSVMFAPLVDEILRERRLTGRFFCAAGIQPDLFRKKYTSATDIGTADDWRRYDAAQKRIVDTCRPSLVLWIQRYDGRQCAEILRSIEYISQRSTCVFFQQAPVLNIGDVCALDVFGYYRNVAHKPLGQLLISETKRTRLQRDQFEQTLLSAFRGNEGFKWFNTSEELLASDGSVRWWDGVDKLYYIDDDHLSEYGVGLFRARLEELIVSTVATTHPPTRIATGP